VEDPTEIATSNDRNGLWAWLMGAGGGGGWGYHSAIATGVSQWIMAYSGLRIYLCLIYAYSSIAYIECALFSVFRFLVSNNNYLVFA